VSALPSNLACVPSVPAAFNFLLEPQPESLWGPERALVDHAELAAKRLQSLWPGGNDAVTTQVSEECLRHLVNEEALRQYWEEELTKAGLSLTSDAVLNPDGSITSRGVNEGKFPLERPRRLPPWKPKPKTEPRPSRPMAPSAEQELRRDRLGETIGIVAGEPRPFGARSVKSKSPGLSQTERKSLLEKMYPPYLVIPALAPPTAEGKDGAYLVQDDRCRHASCEGSDDQSENDVMPERTGGGFANIPAPHAIYRSTGQQAFERRLKEHEVNSALERMRVSSAEVQWALMEICVKGRRPSDVAAERDSLDPKKLYVQAKRLRLRFRSPKPKKVKTPRIPIAVKTVVINGAEHTVSV
jgi:hypothetical protein